MADLGHSISNVNYYREFVICTCVSRGI